MLAEERYAKILELIKNKNTVKVSFLTKLFDVSIETVRRDLEYLEKEGFLKRVYGGAVLEKVDAKHQLFHAREKEFVEEKHEIGEIACRYLEEGFSVALDVSTTNLEVARAMKRRFKTLTILTNSLIIANELSDMESYTLILTGGIFSNTEFSLTGDMCESNIEQFHVDISFISASGISLNAGITDVRFGEVQAKKKMIDISQKAVVVCNSSRFNIVSLLKVCSLDRIDSIITDSKIAKPVLEKYQNTGVEIIYE